MSSDPAALDKTRPAISRGRLLLAVLLTAVFAFIIGRLVVNLIQQQAITTLFGARLEAAALIDTRERQHTTFLQQLSAQEDVHQVVRVSGSPVPYPRLEGQANDHDADTLILLDQAGMVVVRLDAIRTPDLLTISNYQSMAGEDYSTWSIVQNALASSPSGQQSYSAIMDAPGGPTLMTSLPIVGLGADGNERVIGVAVVGSSLERLLLAARTNNNLDLVFLTPAEELITSTANNWQEINSNVIEQGVYQEIQSAQLPNTGEPTYLLNGRYYVTFQELILRENLIGTIGVIQPTRLPIERANPNFTAALISAVSVLFVASTFVLIRRLFVPLSQLINISRKVSPEPSKAGSELRALVTTFQNMVTDLQHVNENLEQENAKSKAILESIADGVLVLDHTGQIVLKNPAAERMLSSNGKDPLHLLQPALLSNDKSVKVPAGGRILSVFRTSVEMQEVGDVFVLRDITDEEIAARTKSNFLNQIGHELRTPLTSLMSYADILHSQGERLPADIREQATNTIFEQGETLGMIINHLIEVTELESGLLSLNPQPTDLRTTVSKALTEINQPNTTNIRLAFDQNPTVASVDSTYLTRAVKALILNAIRYSPADGEVTIAVKAQGHWALVSVTDQGMGISEQDLPHIFERFYRGTPVDSEGNLIDVRGTGIGLFLVKTVVEAHQGIIDVESTLGEGSTFTISLLLV